MAPSAVQIWIYAQVLSVWHHGLFKLLRLLLKPLSLLLPFFYWRPPPDSVAIDFRVCMRRTLHQYRPVIVPKLVLSQSAVCRERHERALNIRAGANIWSTQSLCSKVACMLMPEEATRIPMSTFKESVGLPSIVWQIVARGHGHNHIHMEPETKVICTCCSLTNIAIYSLPKTWSCTPFWRCMESPTAVQCDSMHFTVR